MSLERGTPEDVGRTSRKGQKVSAAQPKPGFCRGGNGPTNVSHFKQDAAFQESMSPREHQESDVEAFPDLRAVAAGRGLALSFPLRPEPRALPRSEGVLFLSLLGERM